MADDTVLRQELATLLQGGEAHAGLVRGFEYLSPEHRHLRPAGLAHSVWELLEHMRIAQHDILQYLTNPDWKSPDWPEGYWPAGDSAPSAEEWDASYHQFFEDLQEAVHMIENSGTDLTAALPDHPEHTTLRELFLIADHNAHHLGQVIQVRKALDDWPG